MTFRGLAAEVVGRLAPHAPAGLELREEPEGFLRAALGGERWEVFALDEPELEEEVAQETYDPPFPAFAVLEALDFVQEVAHTELGLEWPTGEPWARLEDEEIRFGFGDGLSFESIPLTALHDDRA